MPFGLIGQAVEVVRAGGIWLIRHRGRLVAEHPVLAGRAQLSVLPEHGPGAALRNSRKRYASTARSVDEFRSRLGDEREVEVRDLAIYDTLLQVAPEALREAA